MNELVVDGIRAGEQAFSGLTSKQRLAALGVVLVTVAVVLVLFELVTGTLYYSSLDRRLALLKELSNLHDAGVSGDAELGPIYRQLVAEVTARPTLAILGAFPIAKFLAGASLGLFLAVGGLIQLSTSDPAWKGTLALGCVLAAILGVIGAAIPDLGGWWVNVVVYLLLYVLLLALSMRMDSSPPAQVAP